MSYQDPDAPYYHRALDFEALCRAYPPSREYADTVAKVSRDELRAIQEARFIAQVKRAWEIPFYQRHWQKAGLKSGDIRTLDDLQIIPPYSVADLRESIERAPPFGDQIGIDWDTSKPIPLLLQTSGGTTGLPRPMIYTPQDRETMNIISSRRLWMQNVRPFDRVQVALTLGLANGGATGPRGPLEVLRCHPCDDGLGSSHTDPSTDRDNEGLGDQSPGRFPGLPSPHGDGRPR